MAVINCCRSFSVTTHRNLISVLQCLVPTVKVNVPTVTVTLLAFYFKQDVGIA